MMALGSEEGLPLPPIPSSAAAAAVPTRLFGGGGGAGEGVCAACGGGGGRAPCPYCGAALAPPPFGHGAYYEAEDVSALPRRGLSPPIPRLQRARRPPRPGDRPPGHHGSSPALPPWPSSPPPRGTRGGGSRQRGAISPEEVLRLLGPTRATSPRRGRREDPPPPPRREEPPQWLPPVDGVRTVTMDRPPDATGQGFGICVKGGKEAGGGVYISRVEPGSVAERAGLRPGDSILQANGTPFRGITHEEALKMLKSCRTLSMTVESSPQPVQEQMPLRQHPIPRIPPPSGCRYSWVDRVGRPVSPPPPVPAPSSGAPRSPPNRDGSIRKVELSIEPGQSLGLMIRGGAEYDLGVFVTGVDEGSAAERAGLKVGDQILEVNGVSFLSLSHDEAVHRLKHPRRMTLTVRDVGRVPHSSSVSGRSPFDSRFASGFPEPAPYLQASTSDEEEAAVAPEEEDEEEEEQRLLLPWCASALPSSSAVDGGGRGVLGCPSLQMVEEKARRVLRKSEFATLAYYMREYAARRMAIDAFLAVLLEMLSTPEKYTLLTELREVVALEDRGRFDELVYRREAEGQRCRELRQMLMAGNPSNSAARGPLAPSGRRHSLSGAECCPGLLADGDGDAGADELDHGLYDDPNMCGYLDGIRSHLGDWTQRVKSWYWGRPPEPSQGGVFESMAVGGDESTTGEETGAESGDGGRQQGGARRPLLGGVGNQGGEQSGSQQGDYADGENVGNSSVVTDQQGNLRITVRKTRPMLGIAIEGGANTKHPLPRIINIHEDGAAFEAGGLEVGQLILEVDGQKVEGLGHQEVARLIAESFARKSRPGIEFLVIEAKKSNLEPKPTALIFLEA